MTLMFTPALFTIAETWKRPKCQLAEEWIKSICYVYTIEYYPATEKKYDLQQHRRTKIFKSEVNQTMKDIAYNTYIWNIKWMIKMNLFTKQK